MKRWSEKGLSLIELLVVIVIIIVLATLIINGVFSSRKRAHDARIQNALGQLRYQAEIAYDSQGASYQNWSQEASIQSRMNILLEEIDKNYGDPPGAPYVTVIRQSQNSEYCVSAPAVSEDGRFYCIDVTGSLQNTGSECPDEPEDGAPLRCPAT